MAKSKNNVITFGLSGKVGDLLIFRQLDGKTVVSKYSQKRKKVSEKQKAQRKRFQQAVIYAKEAMETPEFRELYEAGAKKGKKPYIVALADFMNAPDIDEIDLSEYAGAVGDKIRISVSDDFAVKSVTVVIQNPAGETLETGEAVRKAGALWIYTATTEINDLANNKILVSASDIPGNVSNMETEINS